MGVIVGLAGPLFSAAAAHALAPAVPAAPPAPPAAPDGVTVPYDWILWIWAAVVLVTLWMGDVIRPGSPARHAKRDVRGHPALVWLLAGLVTFMSVSFGMSLTAGALDLTGMTPADKTASTAALSFGGFLVGAIVGGLIVYLMASGATAGSAGAQGAGTSGGPGLRPRFADAPIGLGWMLLVYPLVVVASVLGGLAYRVVTGHDPDPIAHEQLRWMVDDPSSPAAWILIVVAVLGAPIYEELVYRVFLQSAILRLIARRWLAILLTAIVFGLTHRLGDTVPWHAIPALITLGALMGLVYERTGRLGVPIVMHAAFNAGNILLAMIGGD